MSDSVLDQLERLIRTDPAQRGLIASEPQFGPLLLGQLQRAAVELANHAKSVAIATGFFIPAATPAAAETDGPLGSLILAEVLNQLGVESQVLTDRLCFDAIQTAANTLPSRIGLSSGDDSFLTTESAHISHLTHLISIERVGPSHTLDSIHQQFPRQPEISQEYSALVPSESQNRCFNMRGECIDQWTEPLHGLFEEAAKFLPPIKTIGIGDGGNEIGMGSIPWTELVRRLPPPHGAKIACRIPCDHTIVAGVSNWGGYALAAAVAWLKGRVEILEPWTSARQYEWLEKLVRDGPAVDGVTRLAEPTVDGLPFATYIQPWDSMRQLLGLKR